MPLQGEQRAQVEQALAAQASEQQAEMEHLSFSRFEALSDGVFAFALTLLVVEIQIPDLTGLRRAEAVDALLGLWPHYLSFAASFALISVMWLHHHSLFSFVRRVNRTVILLNLLSLLTVVFVPYATGVLGKHPGNPVASVFYGASMLAVAISSNLMGMAVARGIILPLGLLPYAVLRRGRSAHLAVTGAYIVAIVLAWNWPYAALGLYGLIAALLFLPNELDRELARARRVALQQQLRR